MGRFGPKEWAALMGSNHLSLQKKKAELLYHGPVSTEGFF
jgi:hypothetical protein